MPELPEVETMRRGIASVVGRRVAEVLRPRCRKRPIAVRPAWPGLRRRMLGRRVERIDRLGKRVVLVFDSADRLVLEPRMTGLVLLADPPTQEHLRLRIVFDESKRGSGELMFWDRRGLGSVQLFSADEFQQHFADGRLGPDALDITSDELRERLRASARAIKVALLDQRAVAGVGNLYASEILFRTGIHPERKCRSLTANDWVRLHASMREVLETAIRYEGSTLSDGTYRNALNQSGNYQRHHAVYDREGQPCRACGGQIIRVVQAQRATFFCPACQKKR